MTSLIINGKTKGVPLNEIIDDYSIKQIKSIAPQLSISELLIIGVQPFNVNNFTHSQNEIKVIKKILKDKMKTVNKNKNSLKEVILTEVFHKNIPLLKSKSIHTYFDKYGFIIKNINPMFKDKIVSSSIAIKKDINCNSNLFSAFAGSNCTKPDTPYIARLKNTPVNLKYFKLKFNGKPVYLIDKIKVPLRIAWKVPYYLLKEFREKNKWGNIKEQLKKKHFNLDVKLIRDITGLQFIVESKDEAYALKDEIFSHGNKIKIITSEDYFINHSKSYEAIHMDASFKNPINDSTEITIIADSYLNANFGPESYWRRMELQKLGIVGNIIDSKTQSLVVDKYPVHAKRFLGIKTGDIKLADPKKYLVEDGLIDRILKLYDASPFKKIR